MKAFKTLGQALVLSALAVGSATGSVEARVQSKGTPHHQPATSLKAAHSEMDPGNPETSRGSRPDEYRVTTRNSTQSSACFEASTDSVMTARGDAHSKPQRSSKREPGSFATLHLCLPQLTSTSNLKRRRAAQDPPESRVVPKPSVASQDVHSILPQISLLNTLFSLANG